jgi:hypothetical protein
MVHRHDKGGRVKVWKAGDLVGVLLTEPERKQNPDATNIPAIVARVLPGGEYIIRYAASLPKRSAHRSGFQG